MRLSREKLQDSTLELAGALGAELALVVQRTYVGQRLRLACPGTVHVLRALGGHGKPAVVLAQVLG